MEVAEDFEPDLVKRLIAPDHEYRDIVRTAIGYSQIKHSVAVEITCHLAAQQIRGASGMIELMATAIINFALIRLFKSPALSLSILARSIRNSIGSFLHPNALSV